MNKIELSNIIAVGGSGGSGTRVVAQILMGAGIFIGDYLNTAYDNLIFTRLFKNPEWFKGSSNADIEKRFTIFEKYMTNKRLSARETIRFLKAVKGTPKYKVSLQFYSRLISKILLNKDHAERYIWAWKEPNTQIYIKYIAEFFNNIKYVHVIRHGLDMAYSSKKQQLKNWGYKFGLQYNKLDSEDDLAIKKLDYWAKINKYVISEGEKLLKDRFYLLNYNKLCESPDIEVPRLIKFLDLDLEEDTIRKLVSIPKVPSTNMRYKQKNINIFPKSLLADVEELGFNI